MSDDRERIVEHLALQWRGPAAGADELLNRSPVYAYLVGALFPVESGTQSVSAIELEEPIAGEGSGGEELEDFDEQESEPSVDRLEEDTGMNLTGAFGWAPQSLGLSFIHDSRAVVVTARAGVYDEVVTPKGSDESGSTAKGRQEEWRRRQLADIELTIPSSPAGAMPVLEGRATLSWRHRQADGRTLSTIAISNAATCEVGTAKSNPAICLFQVSLDCAVESGRIYPYPESSAANASEEELELELRYRSRSTYAIGHGTSASWESSKGPTRVWSESLPTELVPAIRARESTSPFLELRKLASEDLPLATLAAGLREFTSNYQSWTAEQEFSARNASPRHARAASALVERQAGMLARMEAGITLLEENATVLTAFRMANEAMRTQMRQQGLVRESPGVLGAPLPVVEQTAKEPRWHPFQLGFILGALASTVDASHPDRDLVDLIWFPTGGGKTEAYLGLAAIEMIRRRLSSGTRGGGTAVLTRYTMRLLTAQQFQRAATLICALELQRASDDRLRGSEPYSIGLWLGNTTTPGTYKQASDELKSVLKDAVPENRFQVRQCSWCGTPIMPTRWTAKQDHYGVRATTRSFEFFCPHPECSFHEKLPVQVVDEAIFDEPPTMLVATVDKFARLAWIERGGSLFGLGGSMYDPPSLVIQDELHLITGPLGTIVGVYEAALRGLMGWMGRPPKTVASTATIRAAADQVRELMATRVAVFPPSGLDADNNYFSEPDPGTPGRLYLGVMPQAHTPSWSLGQISTELLQSPVELGLTGASKDAYWTLVVYHNSLRELGRTMTILRDDVRSALERRRLSTSEPVREMARDGVEELNGNVSAQDLLRLLDELAVGPDAPNAAALDALATTNILSVGIDVGRLGLMLVNGHPKSTSEYIQATSRVGRGAVSGLVVTMFRSGKPRDRSVFESFRAFHQSYYRQVEPASVTPWSVQARRRALRAALVILLRHAGGLSSNVDAARFDPESATVRKAIAVLSAHVGVADEREAADVRRELDSAVNDWAHRRQAVEADGKSLKFRSRTPEDRLLKQFTDEGVGWPTMNSMRSVDRVVRIRADGERR
jgi:hypothetical protein